jgi:hypothetical protein
MFEKRFMSLSTALPERVVERKKLVHSNQTARFTLDGGDELETHLACVCKKVLAGIQRIVPPCKFEGLLLGGGYGRGEGGVLKTESGDQPYNDLEFYVFIHGNDWLNERRFGEALRHLAHQLTPNAGVEIEFKIISTNKLRRSPPSMFYYDLVMGHRRLWGDEKLLTGCEHHCNAKNLPLSEATRLLMNRCSGLLFAREKLKLEPLTMEDADFAGRNLAKAQLAFGDAVLTAFGQYHWSCLERHKRLRQLLVTETLPWLDEAREHHAAGVEFKLHPRRMFTSCETLEKQHKEITAFALQVWLWLESRRLGCHFQSVRDYALSSPNKCPSANPWRNRVLNAIAFGPIAFFHACSCRHPNERNLKTLALLLWDTSLPESALLDSLQVHADRTETLVRNYQKIWSRFN